MTIVGIENISPDELRFELERGARFIMYHYCVSFILMSLKRPSNVYFVRPDEREIPKAIGFSVLSLFLGWWGLPWGPIWTISTIAKNLSGGTDVTEAVLEQFAGSAT